jgi:hypothetical protein
MLMHTLEWEKPLRTSSQVLLRSFEPLKLALQKYPHVRLRLEKVGRYYTFTTPV